MPTKISLDNMQSSVVTAIAAGGSSAIPKITSIAVANSSYTILDDTVVDTAGGYIVITGTGFTAGCQVIINDVAANSTSFVSSTTVRAQIGARAAGTYIVYLTNPDGGTAIRINGITYSGLPEWVTDSTLVSGEVDSFISYNLSATDATSYSLQAGSSLPTGMTLSANGYLSGTVTGITDETVYSFTIVAIDAESQDSPRTFSITITIADTYFPYVSLLLSATNQPANNNVFVDNSTNNFLITRNGNTTQGTFSPYPGTWSTYFSASSNYQSINAQSALSFSGDFTIETWVYINSISSYSAVIEARNALNSNAWVFGIYNTSGNKLDFFYGGGGRLTSAATISLNTWNHVAISRSGSTIRMFINGVLDANTATVAGAINASGATQYIAALYDGNGYNLIGYISNLRVVKGTAVYTSTFTVPTAPLLPITNTSLLICNSNRFIDMAGNVPITNYGTVSTQKFSPFTLQTQPTSTSYSVYFDGTGDWITTPNVSAFDFSNSATDFTIEAWVYNTGPGESRGIFGARANGAVSGWCLYISSSDTLNMGSVIVGQAYADRQMNAITIPGYAWTHVALVKDATGYVGYVNGVGGTKLALTGGLDYQSTQPVTVGALASQGELPFVGLISNARIVKGTAVYTANFTPPTSPLTAIANTSLLTCQSTTIIDNSSNAFTITINGNSQPVSQNPFGYTNPAAAAYTTATLGGSMYFDGTGDYLTTPSNAAFNLNANFTVEAWVYPTNLSGARQIFSTRASSATATTTAWSLCQNGSALGWFTTAYNISGGTINLNAWNHMAAVRSGSTLTVYLNGISIGTATLSNNFTNQQLAIGACIDGTEPFIGYISDARVVKGQALYTSAFVPPAAPLTAVQNNVLLLNGTNAGIYDSSTVSELETVGNTSTNTSITKFANKSSIYFDGTGDYLLAPASQNIVFGTGNFTIECWLYLTATGVDDGIIIENRSSGASTSGFAFNTRGVAGGYKINFYVGGFNITPNSVTYSSWNHIAVTRSSGTVRIFLNGVIDLTATINTNLTDSSMTIGQSLLYANSNITGYMYDLRITKGIARYTANFTPPDKELPRK